MGGLTSSSGRDRLIRFRAAARGRRTRGPHEPKSAVRPRNNTHTTPLLCDGPLVTGLIVESQHREGRERKKKRGTRRSRLTGREKSFGRTTISEPTPPPRSHLVRTHLPRSTALPDSGVGRRKKTQLFSLLPFLCPFLVSASATFWLLEGSRPAAGAHWNPYFAGLVLAQTPAGAERQGSSEGKFWVLWLTQGSAP